MYVYNSTNCLNLSFAFPTCLLFLPTSTYKRRLDKFLEEDDRWKHISKFHPWTAICRPDDFFAPAVVFLCCAGHNLTPDQANQMRAKEIFG